MPFDEKLASRTREVLSARNDVSERRMFGGLAFLVRGHMCCGIVGSDLVVRVGAKEYLDALEQPHARPMDFTGKPLNGMVYVAPAGLRTLPGLRRWVERGLAYVAALPPKPSGRARSA